MDEDYFARNWLYDADGKGWNISMDTMDDYKADCLYRQRMYDRLGYGKTTSEWDEYLQKHDEYIENASPREEYVSVVGAKELQMGVAKEYGLPDPYRNRYVENPHKYCELIKQNIGAAIAERQGFEVDPQTREMVGKIAALPPELLHLHDAIFMEGESVENPEIKSPKDVPRYWWDEDVISEEFGNAPTEKSSADYRVDWYLGQVEKGK